MKGDFTRFTHDRSKRYTRVLMQQGRVALDADWNEQADIHDERFRAGARDVVGPHGVPKTVDGGGGDGFKVGVDATTLDLTLQAGRIWVDGLVSELESPTTYLTQPVTPSDSIDPVEGRTDLAYVEVWERHVTAIEDARIREVALGGPDTTTRVQTVWQLRVLRDVGEGAECDGPIPGWPLPESGGRLTTDHDPRDEPSDPCVVVPGAEYRGSENRLYRVEVHHPGDPLPEGAVEAGEGVATFKWSRDNGSVVFPVAELLRGTAPAGRVRQARVLRFGRDPALALRADDWVEISDEERERAGTPGTLMRVESVDPATRVVTFATDFPASAHAGKSSLHLRRWDQRDGADARGVVPVRAGKVQLEDGVVVEFSGSDFRTGDHWVFTARTTDGKVEPLTAAPPRGVRRHRAPLALVTWRKTYKGGGTVWDPIVKDCRAKFPPLTRITAEDVRYDDAHCGLGAGTVQEALDALCWRTVALRLVGGDGQEGPAGETLRCPIVAGAEDERGRPVRDAVLRFRVAAGGGTLTHDSTTGASLEVATDENGLAQVAWRLGNATECQEVEVRVRDGAPQGDALPIRFRAATRPRHLVLRLVGGDGQEGPPNEELACPLVLGVEGEDGRPRAEVDVVLSAAPEGDRLRDLAAPGSPAREIRVRTDENGLARAAWTLSDVPECHEVVARIADPVQGRALPVEFHARTERPVRDDLPRVRRTSWQNDRVVPLDELQKGLVVHFSRRMHTGAARPDVFTLAVDVAETGDGGAGMPGHRPFLVPGTVEPSEEGDSWTFKPDAALDDDVLQDWLEREKGTSGRESVRCRVRILGYAAPDAKTGRRLDGRVLSKIVRESGPSGEEIHVVELVPEETSGVEGSDFESWFHLTPSGVREFDLLLVRDSSSELYRVPTTGGSVVTAPGGRVVPTSGGHVVPRPPG